MPFYSRLIQVFLLLFLGFMPYLNAQERPLPATFTGDSLIQVDSVALLQAQQEALAESRRYVFPDPNRPNQLIAEIRDSLIVSDGNFMRWVHFVNSLEKKQEKQRFVGYPKEYRESWLIFSVLSLILTLAIIRYFFAADFQLILQAYFNDRLLVQVSKEDTILTSWSFILLYIVFSFSLGLFICLFYGYIRQELHYLEIALYLKVSLAVGFLFALKIGFIRFIAFVFEIQKLVREYVTILYLVYFNSLLILIPAILLISLFAVNQTYYIYLIAIGLIVLLFLFRFLKAGYNLFGHYKFSIFYLILYLCCLEIAPILILVRLLR